MSSANGKQEQAKQKRTPLRTCVACRATSGKREFVRIVRTVEGVDIDSTGKASGRGAYICRTAKCIEAAVKGKRLDKALRTQVPPEIYNRLRELASVES